MRNIFKKKFLMLAGGVALAASFLLRDGENREFSDDAAKTVTVSVDGAEYVFSDTEAGTVAGVFDEKKIALADGDRVFPDPGTGLSSGMTVYVEREKKVSIKVDGETKKFLTHARRVQDAIDEAGIALQEDDIVKPDRESFLEAEGTIAITRVEIREETVEKKIAFETVENEDDDLSWRKRVVTQKGENGVRAYHYRVSYHDGKEVARKLLGSEVTKEPVKEIVTQGTYVKTGKSHSGAASWYAHTGTMAAANPWLPMGSYVKVTNKQNGKSVIVKINDRGPFVPGRIIDLDKVAFQKIASIGAGVIDVKMEEIIN